jgi:single-stranded-DNA-specific exonuclease
MAGLARELERRNVVPADQARRAVADALDLVALGTVADLVALDGNNRILVREGLKRIRAGRARPGIEALFRVAGRDPENARSADLGFAVAPRLNAAGRLTDMSLGIECLLASDPAKARELAGKLDELNRARQDLQARMVSEAVAHVDAITATLGDAHDALCLFDPGWHEGIVGLVAARVRERADCPVVAFAPSEDAGVLKGSARSVDGLHIRDALAAVATRGTVKGMTYGGHAMAAGVRLPATSLDAFRAAFVDEVGRQLGQLETGRVVWTDGPLEPGEMRLEVAEGLHFAGPWGQGFPEPLFDNELAVMDQRVLKDAHLKLQLRHPEGGDPIEAIAFNETRPMPSRVRFLYRLGINDFGGLRRRQLVVEHIHYE